MKKLVFIVATACLFVAFGAETAPVKKVANKRPLAERMAELRRKNRKPTGGTVVKQYEGKIIAVCDRQNVFTPAEVETAVSELRRSVRLPFFRQAPEAAPTNSGVEIVICDEIAHAKARHVLAAPEEGYAELATKWLVADSPKPDWRARRLRLEILRAAGMAMGVGYSMYQPCVMCKVHTLEDLDSVKIDVLGPEGEGNFDECGKIYGLGRVVVRTYRVACREGWAPKPENDEQRKIWNEIMSLPEKPITIEKK